MGPVDRFSTRSCILVLVLFCWSVTSAQALPDLFNTTCASTDECGTEGLICAQSRCTFCLGDTGSDEYRCENAFNTVIMRCKASEDEQTTDCSSEAGHCLCKHKSLVNDGSGGGWDALMAICIFVGGAMAAGGGVGGGGVFVPMLLLIGKFQVLILGASIVNWVQLGQNRHPTANRPLIDYSVALLIQPLALAGTVLGVILNQVFPQWLTLFLLLALLFYTIYKSGTKAIQLFRDESKAQSPAAAPAEAPKEEKPPVVPQKPQNGVANGVDEDEEIVSIDDAIEDSTSFHHSHNILKQLPQAPNGAGADGEPFEPIESSMVYPALQKLLDEESRTPWKMLAVLFAILVGVTLHSLVTGTGSRPSLFGITRCSAAYWVVLLLAFPVLGVVALFVARHLIKMHAKRERLNYTFAKGDIQWTRRTVLLISGISLFAGVLASLLGVGGGMIIGPVLLELAVPPDVSAATSSFMILFTSASSVAGFGLANMITWDYALMLIFVGALASWAGQAVLTYLIKKYKKKSVIVMLIVAVILISAVLLSWSGISSLLRDIRLERPMGFRRFCPVE